MPNLFILSFVSLYIDSDVHSVFIIYCTEQVGPYVPIADCTVGMV